MSLVDKIALIDQERRRVEDQFNTELNAGLTQFHAMKTKEETEARSEELRQQGIVTGTETEITDTGRRKVTRFGGGREDRVDVATDTTTKLPGEKTYYNKETGESLSVTIDESGVATDRFGKIVENYQDKFSESKTIITYKDGTVMNTITKKVTTPAGKEVKLTKAQNKALTEKTKAEVRLDKLISDKDVFTAIVASGEDGFDLKGNIITPEQAVTELQNIYIQMGAENKAIERWDKRVGKKFGGEVDAPGAVEEADTTTEQRKEGETIDDYLKRIGK